MTAKDPNPKDMAATTRCPLHLVPDPAIAELAVVMWFGAKKYGAYNWRTTEVAVSTYVAAARRHLAQFWNGEDDDAESGVSHLAHAMACLAIMLDAKAQGNLRDDRPPRGRMSEALAKASEAISRLSERDGVG